MSINVRPSDGDSSSDRPLEKLSMALIRSSNVLPHEKDLPPDKLADLLLNKKVLHLEYLRIGGSILSLEPFSNLTELYLQRNSIEEIGDGLELSTNLRLLCLGGNKLTSAEGLFSLNRLEVLDLSGNPIESFGRYGENVFPPSITILDLSETPAAELEGHRRKAVTTLSRLKILDNRKVTEADGDNRASCMHIIVPLDEDDGASAGEVVLKFQRDSDLWAVADTFCKVNDIEEELARRQLVVMMKKEARRVWGVTVQDGEVTMRKMIETVSLTKDRDDGEVNYQTMGEERFDSVRDNTMRAIDAVENFMTELENGERRLEGVDEGEEKGGEEEGDDVVVKKQSMAEKIKEKSTVRQEKDFQVSDAALKEAQEILARKIEIIKKEKLAARRRDRKVREEAMMKVKQASILPPTAPPSQEEKEEEGKEETKERESYGKVKNMNVYGEEEGEGDENYEVMTNRK
ncbi:hypothetical protein TrCOL_g5311 [Triparma columacea]|uniref:Uncharacterized protein n=1 Tax=Triparma columacea TaxID=722753 RepID=A0A9W7GKR5_9STRA|nr:hypothetical protein TrCOL_g5311 [Triparma columacea]